MAKLDYMNDYIVPIGVGGIELGLKKWDESRLAAATAAGKPAPMAFAPIAPYAIAGLGTVARITNMLSKYDESIKMAVAAALPGVVTGVYDWVTGNIGSQVSPRATVTPIRRGVTVGRVGARTPEAEGIRIV